MLPMRADGGNIIHPGKDPLGSVLEQFGREDRGDSSLITVYGVGQESIIVFPLIVQDYSGENERGL